MRLHFINLLRGHSNLAVSSACLDEVEDLARLEVLLAADGLNFDLLLSKGLVVLLLLIILSVLVVTDVDELLFLFKHLFFFDELIAVLDDILCSLLHVMECNGQAHDLELLLVDAGVEEYAFFVCREQLLLELDLDLDNLLLDALQVDLPLFALLFFGVGKSLLELLKFDLFVLIHLFLGLVHPLFTHELVFELVLLLLEDELIASNHGLEAALPNVVALKECLLLLALALGFLHLGTLLGIEVPFDSDLRFLIDLEDMLWPFGQMLLEFLKNDRLLKALKQVTDLLVFLANSKNVIILVLLQLGELFVEVTLQLEHNLFQEFDLGTLSLVTEKIVRLVEQIEDVRVLKSRLDVINAALSLNNLPMDLLHTLDVSLLALGCESGESCLLIWVSLSGLSAQLALRDCQDGLELAVALHLIHVDIVKLVILLLQLASTCFLKNTGSFSNRVVIQELWLSTDTILKIVFKATELSLIEGLSHFTLHAVQFLLELNLALEDQLGEQAVLLRSSLADGIVVDQLFALDRLAGLAVDVHLVPCLLGAAFLQQHHGQTGDLALLADVRT